MVYTLRSIRIQNFCGNGEAPAFRRDVNHLPLRHRERHHVQPAAIAQHQRQCTHIRQRFLLLGFLRCGFGRHDTHFAAPVIAILSAFVSAILVRPNRLILRRDLLLVIALLVLWLHRFLWLVHRRIARRRIIISANSEQIDHPRCASRCRDWRRIMPRTQWRADRYEDSVASILVSLR